MNEITDWIAHADALELEQITFAVLKRYKVLHPGWELCVLTVKETENQQELLDKLQRILQ